MNEGRILHDGQSLEPDVPQTKVSVSSVSCLQELREFAESNKDVVKTEVDGETLIIDVAGGADKCAELLKQAVLGGYRIWEFKVMARDMQSEYLRVVAMCKGDLND